MRTLLALAVMTASAFAAEGFHVIGKVQIGGTGGWDYVMADSANHRLYVSHGTSVAVVDTRTDKVLGTITDLKGVHGFALAPEFDKGFISNGQGNMVTVFDPKTLAKTGEIATGQNPDSICYEPKTKRVFAFNGRSNDTTVIDAKTNAVVATVPVGPKPEFCAADGAGHMYVNLENSSEIVELDAAEPKVARRAPLAPCEAPSGLAIDTRGKKLFSVCENKIMAVTDIASLKVVATPAIGQGPDAAGYDPALGLAFSSNGRDGTLTVVQTAGGKYEPIETVTTERGARTMTIDEKTHRIYLLTAEFGPQPEGRQGRPPILPDTFHVLVVGR